MTLLEAYGTYVTGWADVRARFERTAAGYAGGGGRSTHQTIASWIGSDLARIVAIERHETRLEGKLTRFSYRVTHLGPQFAHFTTQTEDVA